jgi:hypothetical protein
LLRCSATLHDDIITFFKTHERSARSDWDVRFVRYGVLWGKADNFLIFSVPDVASFIKFGSYVRKHSKGEVRSMDSRLIFPTMHYKHPDHHTPKDWVSHLVFLPVDALNVETVYEKLRERAEHQYFDEHDNVRISYVAVATGEDDVFFITDAASTEAHQEYITTGFINSQYMAANTSSFAISNDSSRSPLVRTRRPRRRLRR